MPSVSSRSLALSAVLVLVALASAQTQAPTQPTTQPPVQLQTQAPTKPPVQTTQAPTSAPITVVKQGADGSKTIVTASTTTTVNPTTSKPEKSAVIISTTENGNKQPVTTVQKVTGSEVKQAVKSATQGGVKVSSVKKSIQKRIAPSSNVRINPIRVTEANGIVTIGFKDEPATIHLPSLSSDQPVKAESSPAFIEFKEARQRLRAVMLKVHRRIKYLTSWINALRNSKHKTASQARKIRRLSRKLKKSHLRQQNLRDVRQKLIRLESKYFPGWTRALSVCPDGWNYLGFVLKSRKVACLPTESSPPGNPQCNQLATFSKNEERCTWSVDCKVEWTGVNCYKPDAQQIQIAKSAASNAPASSPVAKATASLPANAPPAVKQAVATAAKVTASGAHVESKLNDQREQAQQMISSISALKSTLNEEEKVVAASISRMLKAVARIADQVAQGHGNLYSHRVKVRRLVRALRNRVSTSHGSIRTQAQQALQVARNVAKAIRTKIALRKSTKRAVRRLRRAIAELRRRMIEEKNADKRAELLSQIKSLRKQRETLGLALKSSQQQAAAQKAAVIEKLIQSVHDHHLNADDPSVNQLVEKLEALRKSLLKTAHGTHVQRMQRSLKAITAQIANYEAKLAAAKTQLEMDVYQGVLERLNKKKAAAETAVKADDEAKALQRLITEISSRTQTAGKNNVALQVLSNLLQDAREKIRVSEQRASVSQEPSPYKRVKVVRDSRGRKIHVRCKKYRIIRNADGTVVKIPVKFRRSSLSRKAKSRARKLQTKLANTFKRLMQTVSSSPTGTASIKPVVIPASTVPKTVTLPSGLQVTVQSIVPPAAVGSLASANPAPGTLLAKKLNSGVPVSPAQVEKVLAKAAVQNTIKAAVVKSQIRSQILAIDSTINQANTLAKKLNSQERESYREARRLARKIAAIVKLATSTTTIADLNELMAKLQRATLKQEMLTEGASAMLKDIIQLLLNSAEDARKVVRSKVRFLLRKKMEAKKLERAAARLRHEAAQTSDPEKRAALRAQAESISNAAFKAALPPVKLDSQSRAHINDLSQRIEKLKSRLEIAEGDKAAELRATLKSMQRERQSVELEARLRNSPEPTSQAQYRAQQRIRRRLDRLRNPHLYVYRNGRWRRRGHGRRNPNRRPRGYGRRRYSNGGYGRRRYSNGGYGRRRYSNGGYGRPRYYKGGYGRRRHYNGGYGRPYRRHYSHHGYPVARPAYATRPSYAAPVHRPRHEERSTPVERRHEERHAPVERRHPSPPIYEHRPLPTPPPRVYEHRPVEHRESPPPARVEHRSPPPPRVAEHMPPPPPPPPPPRVEHHSPPPPPRVEPYIPPPTPRVERQVPPPLPREPILGRFLTG